MTFKFIGVKQVMIRATIIYVNKDSRGNVVSLDLKDNTGKIMKGLAVQAVKGAVDSGKLEIIDEVKMRVKSTLKEGGRYPLYLVVEYVYGEGVNSDIIKYGPFFENDEQLLSQYIDMLNKCKSVRNEQYYFDSVEVSKVLANQDYYNTTGKLVNMQNNSIYRIGFTFQHDPMSRVDRHARIKRIGLYSNMVDTRLHKYFIVTYVFGNDVYRQNKAYGPFYGDTPEELHEYNAFKIGIYNAANTGDTESFGKSGIANKYKFKVLKDTIYGEDARVLAVYESDDDIGPYKVVEDFVKWL